MIRKEAVAGQFYAGNLKSLKQQIITCFTGKWGPTTLPASKKHGKIYGIAAPHAGYEFSGGCAAWAYKALAEANHGDLFIILGVNHQGIGNKMSFSFDDFQTPLGIIKNNNSFASAIIKKMRSEGIDADQNENAHENEHSIEVQLPFLLFVSPDSTFVPILLSSCSYDECKKLGEAIASFSENFNKNICIIASGDFTHFGPEYGFVPFAKDIKNNLYRLDRKAIDKITCLDSKGFYEEAKKTNICGRDTITTAIEACKALGSKKAEWLRYYTSGDVLDDYINAVGYASFAFR